VYRYLTWCHPDIKLCEFEPHLFTQRDGLPYGVNYLPDFRCTLHNGKQVYIEVKGVMDKRSQRVLAVMKMYRPDVRIEVIDDKIYQVIKKKFSKIIPGWE